MKYIFLIVLLLVALSLPVSANPPPLPPPPSDEQKAEWQRLGDENLRMYGSGEVNNTEPVVPQATAVPPTFTPSPTASPSPTLTLAPTATPTPPVFKRVQLSITGFFQGILKAFGLR